MSLRSILGGSGRVRKKTGSGSSSPRKRSTQSRSSGSGSRAGKNRDQDDADDDYLGDERLDDMELVVALATDLHLRDTAQAMRYLRAHMFAPVPLQGGAGLSSTRIANELHFRRRLPPVATVAHVQTLLASPSAVEREVAELARAGVLRRIEVPRRGEVGETLILSADLEGLLEGKYYYGNDEISTGKTAAPEASSRQQLPLSAGVRARFTAFLREHPVAQTVPRSALPAADVDELFRAGFLTAEHAATSALSGTMNLYARPEAKTTLVSIEHVSRQAAGSMGAVGGVGALVHAGGSSGAVGGGAVALPASVTELRLAIPGNGVFLKLVAAALEHLLSLLGKSRFREAPESVLRDRWNGGVADSKENEARDAARRARGEFTGLLPGQTRKWKQFHGLTFEWVLREAVGSGLVEVFETGSVGRGVRCI
jgi:hypothetical protein